ncbi:MAG TPA: hypothetical protein VGS10_17125 [Terracidiphilus sp.]|nr:hypothetical protein [Terracidiphilus sp.]
MILRLNHKSVSEFATFVLYPWAAMASIYRLWSPPPPLQVGQDGPGSIGPVMAAPKKW